MPTDRTLTVNMKVSIGLLCIFLIAVILAFAVTVATTPIQVQIISVAFITPLVI